jgi:hypothetical protein
MSKNDLFSRKLYLHAIIFQEDLEIRKEEVVDHSGIIQWPGPDRNAFLLS